MSGALALGKVRWGLLLVVTALVLAGAGIYAIGAYQRFEESRSAASTVGITAAQPLPDVPFVLFRNTASGQGYGHAATVPLSAPGEPGPSANRNATGFMEQRNLPSA